MNPHDHRPSLMGDDDRPRLVVDDAPVGCAGTHHRWSPNFSFGDACLCGRFHLVLLDGRWTIVASDDPLIRSSALDLPDALRGG